MGDVYYKLDKKTSNDDWKKGLSIDEIVYHL